MNSSNEDKSTDDLKQELPHPTLDGDQTKSGVSSSVEYDFSYSGKADTSGTSIPGVLRFLVVKAHARGGIGEVFVARDKELNRRVALKEIQNKYADDPSSRARFIIEAEVTGNLEHPGIVPVYGLGSYPDGRPYYAMRLIDGNTLSNAISAFHGSEKNQILVRDYASVEFRELIGRFIAVCDTIAYAHSRGVVHRDIKPSNIMLGKFGETLVVDWGLAKVVDISESVAEIDGLENIRSGSHGSSAMETQEGSVVGTLVYMPPEQAQGRMTGSSQTKADIFSLGATLYQIIAGQPPYRGKASEILPLVRAGQYNSIRAAAPDAPTVLRAICERAMSANPDDRYESPTLLAQDLKSWLADEPIAIVTEPWSTRFRRWARKHPKLISGISAATAVSVLGLSIGLGVVQYQNNQLALANARTEARRLEAVQERTRARTSLNTLIDDVVAKSLSKQVLDKDDRAFLTKVQGLIEELSNTDGKDLQAIRDRASATFRLGVIRSTLGDNEQSEENFRTARDLYDSFSKDDLDAKDRSNQAKASMQLAIRYAESGRMEESEAEFQRAQSVFKEMADLVSEERFLLAKSQSSLGKLYYMLGRLNEAEQEYLRGLETADGVKDFTDTAMLRDTIATLHNGLIAISLELGKYPKAEEHSREEAKILGQLISDAPENPEYKFALATNHANTAKLFALTGRAAEAVDERKKGKVIHSQLVADYPSVPEYKAGLANLLTGYGYLLARLGRNDEAVVEYKQARDIIKSLCAEHPEMLEYQQLLSMVLGNLASVLLQQGKSDEAILNFEDVVKVLESLKKSVGESPEFEDSFAAAVNNLGAAYTSVSRFEDATSRLESAIEIRKRLLTSPSSKADIHHGLAGSYVNLAEVKILQGKFAEARATLEQGRPHHDRAIAFNDKNLTYQAFFKNHLVLFGTVLAELGDIDAMNQTAEEMVANGMVLNASVNWMTLANKEEAAEKKEELLAKIVSLLRAAVDSQAISMQEIEATEELAMLKDRLLRSKK